MNRKPLLHNALEHFFGFLACLWGLFWAGWIIWAIGELLITKAFPGFAAWFNETALVVRHHKWRWEEAVLYPGLFAIFYYRFHQAWGNSLRWCWSKLRRKILKVEVSPK